MKVTMYYLEKELYAYSINEDLIAKFEQERNMNLFHKKVRKLNGKMYKEFMNEHQAKMLVRSPYDTKDGYIELAVTYEEDEQISHEIEILTNAIYSLLDFDIDRHPFTKQMKKDMRSMTGLVSPDKVKIDCLKLFIKMNKRTFLKNKIPNDI